MRGLATALVVVGLLAGSAHLASADVLNMGGTRDPATGQWTGLASLETVPVGDAGNVGTYGAVPYDYRIGKYEVTAGQYTEFLNKVAGVDANQLYSARMAYSTETMGCNILRAGGGTVANPYTYSVASDWANRPVNYVSFWDSCRFANWLHNGQPSGVQDNSTTEDGAYTITWYGINWNTLSRNDNWKWAVTSENEWYKAAYYKGGGTNAGYWDYATSSNSLPGTDRNDASGNNANYGNSYFQNELFTTIAGQFQNSKSPYGTFDQNGNVDEWNETAMYFINGCRIVRGGSFGTGGNLASSFAVEAQTKNSHTGFRVVQVPEPASMALLALGGLLLARRRRA